MKPTDSHSYLDYDSCHPQHNKCSIPYSQFLYIRRICKDWTEFVIHSVKLYPYLSLRGYPSDLVIPALHTVKNQKRGCTDSEEDDNADKKSLFCIITFSSLNPPAKEWIQEAWPILYRSSSTCSLVDMRTIFGYRKPKSLQDILVQTDITINRRKDPFQDVINTNVDTVLELINLDKW